MTNKKRTRVLVLVLTFALIMSVFPEMAIAADRSDESP